MEEEKNLIPVVLPILAEINVNRTFPHDGSVLYLYEIVSIHFVQNKMVLIKIL